MNPWAVPAILAVLLIEAFLATAFLVPLTIRLAPRFGFLAHPGDRHVHEKPTPTLGGSAIVAGVFLVIVTNLAITHFLHLRVLDHLPPEVARTLTTMPRVFPKLGAVLAGALCVSVLGLVDDRRHLGPRLKLVIMILATLPLIWADVRLGGFLPGRWTSPILTIAWIVFLMNSFNFLDNMDGLCAGVAAITATAFGLLSYFSGEWFIAAMYTVLAGALLGFLRHNFNPARTFMGDNGSLFVGYMLGALSVLSTYYVETNHASTAWPLVTPVIVLGVPIFDTLSVLWIRFRAGRPLMQGDKNHFSHRLVDLGLSHRGAVVFIYVITAAVALGAVPLRVVGPSGALAILGQTALLFWIIYRIERAGQARISASGG